MEKIIEYTELYLYNNALVSKECLCMGVLFHDTTTGERRFNSIKNFNRLKAFNDDIDVDFVKAYLAGIKDEVETDMFYLNSDFTTSNFIKSFVGEMRFSDIVSCKTNDDDFIEKTTKLLLKQDFARHERLSRDEEIKIVKNLVKSSACNYSQKSLDGLYGDTINFNFIVGQYCVKIFDFKNRESIKKSIASVKTWSYNAGEMKKGGKYKTVFLYSISENINEKEFEIVKNILLENTEHVMELKDGVRFLIQESGQECAI
ncbi:hypothetical protein LI142_18765 [Eubacterium limosum]|uniref:hypothetical protein n=1 Tax=Eubacterium limosum TaxID=1736 RepID=UPI001D07BA7F|nr:hypothetical protein [Eubacterium limosum]MCB6571546.1 hypothetical protein [Eubacterium limosum]